MYITQGLLVVFIEYTYDMALPYD